MLKTGASPRRNGLTKRLADTQSLLEQMIETVHHFARELRPAMLDDLGLLPALSALIRGAFRREPGFGFVQSQRDRRSLDGERKLSSIGIAQESLNNVAKHARAMRVDVKIQKLRGRVRLQIRDDGNGFQVQQHLANNGDKDWACSA